MWINDEVNLPSALVTAQREGRLVVFAGAGVSMGAPSNLPSFEQLAHAVSGGVLLRASSEPLDAFLGRIEQRDVDVQARARRFIDLPTSAPRQLHHSIVDLFRDAEAFRLVTTNFDRHFTTVARSKYAAVDVFIGPALPLGRDFCGLVYLHGAVEHARSHLVLTDGDFGRAYLADGWATRFLMEMFREYSVLFVGYSHEDPVMRYLARSFVGGTQRYSMTPAGRDEHWSNLGIVPIHFRLRVGPDQYGAIEAALGSWSARNAMGAFEHKARITQLAEGLPPLDPESLDYLRTALTDRANLRFFTHSASRIEWLHWAEDEGFLSPLLTDAAIASDESRMWAYWVAERYAVAHPRELQAFVQRHAATLRAELVDALAFRLGRRDEPVAPETLRLWAAALLALRTTTADSATRLLAKCAEAGVLDAAALLFRFQLRPQLKFERPGRPDFGRPLSVSAEIVLGGNDYELRRAWDETLKGHIDTLYHEFLPMLEDYLTSASTLLRVAGRATDEWDLMSYERSAVEAHGQNRLSSEWGLLMDVARDVIEWTTEHQPSHARSTIERWIEAGPQLLVRLAIHAIARRTDLEPDEALALVERHGWLYSVPLKHETFRLLAHVFPGASDVAQARLIAHSMSASVAGDDAADVAARRTSDYERYNLAVWLGRIAPNSTAAAEHLGRLQAQNAQFRPRPHPDMSRWVSAGFRGSRSPVTVEELLSQPPAVAAKYVAGFEPESGFDEPDRHGLLTMFEQAVTREVGWSLAVAGEMVANGEWKHDVWDSLLDAWRRVELGEASWRVIIDLLERHPPIVKTAPRTVAQFLDHSIRQKELALADVDRLERIGDLVIAAPGADRSDILVNGSTDWLTSAINHPAGVVALVWLRALSYRLEAAGDAWDRIPEALRQRFQRLLGSGDYKAEMGRVAFASQVHFLFAADRLWTEEWIVPLFDWSVDPRRAAQAWDGFLAWGQWNDEPLFHALEPFARQTFARMADLGRDDESLVSQLAGAAVFSASDPWREKGWLFEFISVVEPQHRARWAEQFGRYADSLAPEGRESLWDRWVCAYWDDRLTSTPQHLGESERQAMIGWVVPLCTHASEVVDRILRAPPTTTVDHLTFYSLGQSGIAASHGLELGRLLRGLLRAAGGVSYDTGEVLSLATAALRGGASSVDLVAVAGEMARLGLRGADELRALVDPPPP